MNSEGCWSWGPQGGRIRQPPAFCQICGQEMSVFSSWTCLKSQWEELCLVSLWAGSGRSWMLDPVYGTTLKWLMEWWQARHDSNSKIFDPSLAELPSTKLFMLIIPRVFEYLTLSLSHIQELWTFSYRPRSVSDIKCSSLRKNDAYLLFSTLTAEWYKNKAKQQPTHLKLKLEER